MTAQTIFVPENFIESPAMTIIIEDSEEVKSCTYCMQLRKTFVLIGVSAVLPMLLFTALLLLVAFGKIGTELANVTASIVEFVFILLFVQLFVAIAILLFSFLRRKHPIFKFHIWYLCFHVTVMAFFMCASAVLTAFNDCKILTGFVACGGAIYYYSLYYYLKMDKEGWNVLRRAY